MHNSLAFFLDFILSVGSRILHLVHHSTSLVLGLRRSFLGRLFSVFAQVLELIFGLLSTLLNVISSIGKNSFDFAQNSFALLLSLARCVFRRLLGSIPQILGLVQRPVPSLLSSFNSYIKYWSVQKIIDKFEQLNISRRYLLHSSAFCPAKFNFSRIVSIIRAVFLSASLIYRFEIVQLLVT